MSVPSTSSPPPSPPSPLPIPFSFSAAHIPLFLYPFLHTVSKSRPFEYLRLTSLGVVGALVKVIHTNVDLVTCCCSVYFFATITVITHTYTRTHACMHAHTRTYTDRWSGGYPLSSNHWNHSSLSTYNGVRQWTLKDCSHFHSTKDSSWWDRSGLHMPDVWTIHTRGYDTG